MLAQRYAVNFAHQPARAGAPGHASCQAPTRMRAHSSITGAFGTHRLPSHGQHSNQPARRQRESILWRYGANGCLPDIAVDTVTGAPLLTHRVELALLAVASEDCVRAGADDDHTVVAVIDRDLRAQEAKEAGVTREMHLACPLAQSRRDECLKIGIVTCAQWSRTWMVHPLQSSIINC